MWKPNLNGYEAMKHTKEDMDPTPMEDHPSVDKTLRHPRDTYLRKNGFSIVSRPKVGSVLWGKGKRTYTQEEAEKIIGITGLY